MARYHGYVGYAVDVEAYPGVWEEQIVEHEYYGDVVKNRVNLSQSNLVSGNNNIHPKVNLNNTISIVGDPFAYGHVYQMRYVTYLGTRWMITSVEVERPRLILTLGGVYNE